MWSKERMKEISITMKGNHYNDIIIMMSYFPGRKEQGRLLVGGYR